MLEKDKWEKMKLINRYFRAMLRSPRMEEEKYAICDN